MEYIRVSHEIHRTDSFKCVQCSSSLSTKRELTNHIKDHHITHNPYEYFDEDNCDDDDCRFRHIKLGQYICYKCGKIFRSKREMMKHKEGIHGNNICHRFLRNECRVRRCFFSHKIPAATNVATNMTSPESSATVKNINESPVFNQKDFPNLPTTGSVVMPQVQAQPRYLAPHMPQVCQMDQTQIRDMLDLFRSLSLKSK